MDRDTIRLRKIRPEDVDDLTRLVNDSETTRFLPGLITDHDMLLVWIQSLSEKDHEYMVELADGTVIGECSLSVSDDVGDIGYMLFPQYWQHGYGTAVVYSLLAAAAHMGLTEATATTDTDNTASVRLLEKTGFEVYRQGWMLHLPDEGESEGRGQTVVEYRRTI